jgi:Heterokaryon incompatibility protein (HET)
MTIPNYQYSPLPSGDRSIRLAVLYPGDFEDEIEFRLVHARLDDAPEYESLSYAWGETALTRTTKIEGRALSISLALETALRHLRTRTKDRVLWIDAICINQEDNNERNNQVSFMDDIYATARRVVVWIGPKDGESERAMEFLKEMGTSNTLPKRDRKIVNDENEPRYVAEPH